MYSSMNAWRRLCRSLTLLLNAKSISAAYSRFCSATPPDSHHIAVARKQSACNLAAQRDCVHGIVTRKGSHAGKISAQFLALSASTEDSPRREFHLSDGISQVHGAGIGRIGATALRHFAAAKQA